MTQNEALEVLGLRPPTSQVGIKRAYRDLAKVWHPDRFPEDPGLRARAQEKLKEINAAYQALRDYTPQRTTEPPVERPREATARPAAEQPRRHPPSPPQYPPHTQTKQRAQSGFGGRPWVILLGGVVLLRIIAFVANEPNSRPPRTGSGPVYTVPPALPQAEPTPSVAMPNSGQRRPTTTAIAPPATWPPRQVAGLRPQSRPPSRETVSSGPALPNLSIDERQSIEMACLNAKVLEGPAAYNRCLTSQLNALASSGSRNPDLSSLSTDERQSIEMACLNAKVLEGPAAYNRCLVNQLRSLGVTR
jgi:hypothetical protein